MNGQNKNNKISMKEIARLAGTSVATVSRVINKNGRYSKDTEEKILRIIEEYNYTPNVLAKGLRENKTKLIGVIVPDISLDFFANVYRSIELRLYDLGYLPILCDTMEDDVMEKQYVDNMINMNFAGLITLSGHIHKISNTVPTVYVDRYPLNSAIGSGVGGTGGSGGAGDDRSDDNDRDVRNDRSDDNDNIFFIGCDNFKGGYLAAESMIKAGKKNLGLVLSGKQLETQQQRSKGFMQALKDYNLPFNQDLYTPVERVIYPAGYNSTRQLLDSGIPCDGIFYTSDILALGGLQCLRDNGLSIPTDIAVTGMDNITSSQLFGLTTIQQHTSQMGTRAADTIVALIEGSTPVERKQILDVKLIKRETV